MFKSTPHTGDSVTFTGTARKIRTGKKFTFVEVGHGTEQVQVLASTQEFPKLTEESYVRVTGTVKELPPGVYSHMPFEVHSTKIEVLSMADESTTGQCPPGSSSEVKLTKRLHYFRDSEFIRVMRLSSALCQAFRIYFSKTGCVEIIPPSFTGVECEGGATLFSLEHPGTSRDKPMKAYLTQSSQFALEMMLPGLGDCYCIAPSFRAEHSHTRRHLTEFTHVESEWEGVLTMEDHLQKLSDMLTGVIAEFLILGKDDLKALGLTDRVEKIFAQTQDSIVLSHADAIKKCRELGIEKEPGVPFGDRDDIPEMQERKLIDTLGKIVYLVKFPKEFKSFYMALDPSDESRVLGCDVEVPGVGEIIGSGIRESSYERLLSRLKESKLDPDDYSEYLELRRSGFKMTSGMGLGLGRMLCWLLDRHSIRDVVAFPRFPGYLRP